MMNREPLTKARRHALTVLTDGPARPANTTEIVRSGDTVSRYVNNAAAEWLIANGYAEPFGHQIHATEIGRQRLADEQAGLIR